MAETQTYKVAIEGFILGDFRKKGTSVTLNERQARDFLREGRLVEASSNTAAAKDTGKAQGASTETKAKD